MIQFRIISVSKRASSQVPTVHYTYTGTERKQTGQRTQGAEWVEVEFMSVMEDEPVIAIANISGDAWLPDSPLKLFVHNPEYFNMYKIGDIISFIPDRLVNTPPAPANEDEAASIVVPTLT